MQGRGTFNQGPGRDAFNQAFGSGNDAFSQAIGGGSNVFGQPAGRDGGNAFNQGIGRGRAGNAFDQAIGRGGNNNAFNQNNNKRGGNAFSQNIGRNASNKNNGRGGGSSFGQTTGRGRGGSTFNVNNGRGGNAFNVGNGRENSAFNQAFGDTGFNQPKDNSNQPVFGQQPKNDAFNQAFGNTSGFNKLNDNTSSSVFGQLSTSNACNQAFRNTGFSNLKDNAHQPAFDQAPQNNAFNQAFGNIAFDQPKYNTNQPVFGQQLKNDSFNQAIGKAGFNQSHQTASPKAFTQQSKNNTFNQAFGSTGFNELVAVDSQRQSPKAFTWKSTSDAFGNARAAVAVANNSDQPASPSPKAFSQQLKRTASRGGSSVAARGGRGGRGGTTSTLAKRGGKTAQFPTLFQRKPAPKGMESHSTLKDNGITTAADRAARFGSTSKSVLYDQFKEDRVRERQQAIEQGLIPDPDNPTRLEDAIDFRGSCQGKCPEFEMLEREIQNGLDSLEMDEEGNVDPEKAVKAYRRSAAGIDQPLPSDVRPPEVLVHTLDYLVDEILSHVPLEKCHAFVRDRTRSIRQDFTLQNIRDITAVQLHERIARFHILCLHEMCEMDESKFSKQQETEQLRKVLVSLMEFYDDLREEGIETENEAEFRAYNIVSHIRDQDVARQTMTLPVNVFKSPHITRALEFRALSQRSNEIMESSSRRNKPANIEASQNFYSAFFKLIADQGTSFLMACMLETHFADVRKGALKAMNIAYMIKAGGVQAEDVRQVLAYDSVKQLIEEAQLYGLIVDNSLGVPTIRFGQKHYKNKVAVFVEPLSNPSQKRSLLLVEPKKAGRTFRDIVNGINPNVTPLPNQNVFAPQPNPIESMGTFSFNAKAAPFTPKTPIAINVKLSEITSDQDITSKIQTNNDQVDMAKSKAAAAEALAARERKKLEELEEKKRLELAEKEQAKRVEAERFLREKQMQEELVKQKEREQVELEQKQQDLLRQQREKQMAAMHLNVVKSQLKKRMMDEVMDAIVKEQAQVAVSKAFKSKRLLKKVATPWLSRARSSIAKRNSNAMSRKRKWHFNMYVITHNPYITSDDTIYKAIPAHSTPEGVKERVTQSIQAEKIALDHIDYSKDQEEIWKLEEFPLNIYPRIRDKLMDLKQSRFNGGDMNKPAWQLIISTPDSDADSSIWFRRKFGLDDNFLRKDGLYQAFDVVLRMVTSQTEISCQLADEVGAIIFSLPESKAEKNKAETVLYWENNKMRFNKLVKGLQRYNPGMKVPFLFTYFPDSSSTESTIEKIPTLLGLASNKIVSDYHILVMNPLTISNRIIQEVNWLSNNTVINQE